MEQNIYDNEIFFKEYQALRNNNVGISANDLIEIPSLRMIQVRWNCVQSNFSG